ncbi:hypothetical protein GYA37_01965 [candidate division WWE3 bacterium]|uniref:Type 4 fimbrial biogenesis protein PilX N-terminal domain-containing protein n=1 Tax=candidate division WWE3 bacterium TaxID=2053526 RepID=A0A7X9HSW0_UNCKA|nr:hypothetical protein [candidate division WWE3 bacterium]
MKIENIRTKQKGQTLLFVIVAVTIAMAVGVSVSTRTLDLTRRVSRTDTSARVLAASEGGIERLLTQSEAFLDSLETTNPDCAQAGGEPYTDGKCIISFSSSPEDKITSVAIIDAEKFKLNGPDYYWFDLDPGYIKEVNLEGYTSSKIEVCWDNKDAALYFFSYNKSSKIKKGGFYSEEFPNKEVVSGLVQKTKTRTEHDACGDIDLVSNPYGLRLKTFFASAKIYVYPTGGATGSFPYQGYKLMSKGELSIENDVTDSKTVNVYRSHLYAPSVFDYALYTSGNLD